MGPATWIVIGVAAGAYVIHRLARRAGPRQVREARLRRARPVLRLGRGDSAAHWDQLGSATQARGLDLRFNAADDPAARATLLVSALEQRRPALDNSHTVRLAADFETHHVHTAGYVFRVRLRGTGAAVGRQVRIRMFADSRGQPYGARIENDDQHEPAVGDWIEIDSIEVLELRR